MHENTFQAIIHPRKTNLSQSMIWLPIVDWVRPLEYLYSSIEMVISTCWYTRMFIFQMNYDALCINYLCMFYLTPYCVGVRKRTEFQLWWHCPCKKFIFRHLIYCIYRSLIFLCIILALRLSRARTMILQKQIYLYTCI